MSWIRIRMFLLLCGAVVTTTFCQAASCNNRFSPQRVPLIQMDTQLPSGEKFYWQEKTEIRDTRFETFLLGTTWWEYQHNATQGKQIAVGDDGVIHIAWLKGYDNTGGDRDVIYHCLEDGDIAGGNPINPTGRDGYCTLDVAGGDSPDFPSAAVIGYYGSVNDTMGAWIARDSASCWDTFTSVYHAPTEQGYPPIWPQMCIDNQNRVHLVAGMNVGNPENTIDIYYDCSDDFTNWTNPEWLVVPSYARVVSWTTISSMFDDRVALLAHDHYSLDQDWSDFLWGQMNNFIHLYLSETGVFTDLNPINLWDVSDPSLSPLGGLIYPYCDLDGLFDLEGNLHVVYSTRPFWIEETSLRRVDDGEVIIPHPAAFYPWVRWAPTGQIWHALRTPEGEVSFSHISGYVGDVDEDDDFASFFETNPGAFGSTQDRPSIAIDPFDGTLYVMWRNFTNLPDTSASGFANADLWVRSSCDNGAMWGPAVNITDTQSPGCEPGDCFSEAWGTLAEQVSDGYLHIEYVEDKDAGAVVQGEGQWTENPAYYMRVPIEEISCWDPWNFEPRASRLTDTWWSYMDTLAVGQYQLIDFAHLLNEGIGPYTIDRVEVLHMGNMQLFWMEPLEGSFDDIIGGYTAKAFEFECIYDFSDDDYDIVIRFVTTAGDVDFRIDNRNALPEEGYETLLWWESDSVEPHAQIPLEFSLHSISPNPFNPTTTITYELSAPAELQLVIYNIQGQIVEILVDGFNPAGVSTVQFNAGDLGSGCYFCVMEAGGQRSVTKMLLVR
jgi:hypothetical protein